MSIEVVVRERADGSSSSVERLSNANFLYFVLHVILLPEAWPEVGLVLGL